MGATGLRTCIQSAPSSGVIVQIIGVARGAWLHIVASSLTLHSSMVFDDQMVKLGKWSVQQIDRNLSGVLHRF